MVTIPMTAAVAPVPAGTAAELVWLMVTVSVEMVMAAGSALRSWPSSVLRSTSLAISTAIWVWIWLTLRWIWVTPAYLWTPDSRMEVCASTSSRVEEADPCSRAAAT